MQESIRHDVQLAQSQNPIRDTQEVLLVDYNSDFDYLFDKVDKLEILMKCRRTDTDLIRYLPCIM